jgi:site-specific DNA recombinase
VFGVPICAIYARVSDEVQTRGESVDHQISFMREYARRRSEESGETWETPEHLVYRDDGVTGTSMLKRANVLRLIEDAKQGVFDIVLFKGISRFARNTIDALLMLQTLKTCGVRVISFEENFDSLRDHTELIFTMHSAVAQYESEKTGIRVRIGNFEKARAGKWCGAVPDGYRLDPDTKRLRVDPVRKWLIQRIFGEYLAGKGFWSIAKDLNRDGILTKKGTPFSAKRIREIILNPVYAGDVVYGRREQKLVLPKDGDFLTRKKRTTYTANPTHVAVCKNAHPAIIPRQLFERCQDLVRKRKMSPGRRGTVYLLSGFLYCACGSPMWGKRNQDRLYYVCKQRRSLPVSCDLPSVRAEPLESLIFCHLKKELREHALHKELRTFLTNHHKEERFEPLDPLQSQLKKEKEKSIQLLDIWLSGEISDDQFQTLRRRIEQRIADLETAMNHLQQHAEPLANLKERADQIYENVLDFLSPRTPNRMLTKEMLQCLIRSVHIRMITQHDARISIQYRFSR